jgi:hypothetical protein
MSDETQGLATRRPRLFVPDHSIVSGEKAERTLDRAAKYNGAGKRVRPPADQMQDAMTRQEAMNYLGEAALAVGNKLYDQIAVETGQYLEQMENSLRAEFSDMIQREFRRRSLRGRWETFVAWLRETTVGGYLIEAGVLAPVIVPALVVDAVDVLDPNVTAAKEEAPLRWREFVGWSDAAKAWLEAGGVVIIPTPPKKDTEEAGRIAAGTSTILQRALTAIMDDPADVLALGDDVVVLGLDDELFEAAMRLCQ